MQLKLAKLLASTLQWWMWLLKLTECRALMRPFCQYAEAFNWINDGNPRMVGRKPGPPAVVLCTTHCAEPVQMVRWPLVDRSELAPSATGFVDIGLENWENSPGGCHANLPYDMGPAERPIPLGMGPREVLFDTWWSWSSYSIHHEPPHKLTRFGPAAFCHHP